MKTNGKLVDFESAKAIKLRRKRVHVKSLDGDVLLSEVTGVQRDAIEDFQTNAENSKTANGVAAFVVSLCWIHEDGTQMCKDWKQLNEYLSGNVIVELFNESLDLCGMSKKGVEDIAKN